MLNRNIALYISKCIFAGIALLGGAIGLYLCVANTANLKTINHSPTKDTYFMYEKISDLDADQGPEVSRLLPNSAIDIWVYREHGFGYEDWQVSCIVSESAFKQFAETQLHTSVDEIDSWGFIAVSHRMCRFFYAKRLGIPAGSAESINSRNRYLECYVYDKLNRWHLAYCYDRANNILTCDFGR